MLWAFWMEGVETKQMLKTFARHGRGKIIRSSSQNGPTPEELEQAKAQLKDLPKFLPFFMCIMVPVPGMTEGYVVLAVTLEQWLGHKVSLLPSQIRGVFKKLKEDDAAIESTVVDAEILESLEKNRGQIN